MWWKHQNLDKPIQDSAGKRWHFRVWHDFIDGVYTQRIYFWSEDKQETGMLEFAEGQAVHVRKLKQRITKLVKDPGYRRRYRRKLRFPIDRYY